MSFKMLSYKDDPRPELVWGWELGKQFPFDGCFRDDATVRIIVSGSELEFLRRGFPNATLPIGFNAIINGELARHIGSNMNLLVAETEGGLKILRPDPHVENDAVRAAVEKYYRALDHREHGGIAMSTVFREIERALGMHWVQGATLKTQQDE